MTPNSRKVKVLEIVSNGGTLSDAGKAIGVTGKRARDLLTRLCREIKMPNSLDDIRKKKQDYLDEVEKLKKTPRIELRKSLVYKLVDVLKVKEDTELTPKYLSNITASQLLDNGVTLVAISEIQNWLKKSGVSLKPSPPKDDSEIKYVKQAIAILEAFHFDMSTPKSQLAYLLENS